MFRHGGVSGLGAEAARSRYHRDRRGRVVALLDGPLMAVEGQTSSGSPGITSVETYTIGTNTWR